MQGHAVRGILQQNNAVTAALSLVGVSSAVGLVLAGVRSVWEYIKESFIVSVEVQNSDHCYEWVLEWLSERPEMRNSRRLSVETSYSGNQEGKPIANLVPSMGHHWMRYQNHLVYIKRNRETTFDMASGRMFESLTIAVRARQGGHQILRDLINEALRKGISKDMGKTVVYVNKYGEWNKFGVRSKRPWDSVILPVGVKESLLEDAKVFLSGNAWYRDRGIPYRRGYLLHGIPGSGKSSLVHALAGVLDLNICMVSLAQAELTDQLLMNLLNSAPPNVLLLMEDIDAAFVQRDIGEKSNNVTFAGLLNALDGVAAQEGRLLFMTTNKIQALDPALIRDGRVDMRIHLGPATQDQVGALYAHFYAIPRDSPLIKEFMSVVGSGSVTMAELQGHFMTFRTDAKAAYENISRLLPQNKQH